MMVIPGVTCGMIFVGVSDSVSGVGTGGLVVLVVTLVSLFFCGDGGL